MFEDKDYLYVVLELMQGGDLWIAYSIAPRLSSRIQKPSQINIFAAAQRDKVSTS